MVGCVIAFPKNSLGFTHYLFQVYKGCYSFIYDGCEQLSKQLRRVIPCNGSLMSSLFYISVLLCQLTNHMVYVHSVVYLFISVIHRMSSMLCSNFHLTFPVWRKTQGRPACYAFAGQSPHRDRPSLAVFGRPCRSKFRPSALSTYRSPS